MVALQQAGTRSETWSIVLQRGGREGEGGGD